MLATKCKLAMVVALLGALGLTPEPGKSDEPAGPTMTYRDDVVRGVVAEVDDKTLVLSGGERVTLTEKTQYLRETGLDTELVKLSDIRKGTSVYVGGKKEADGFVARAVVIELFPHAPKKADDGPQPKAPEQVNVSKQHPPRFAVRLAGNRWRGRCAFLDDGRILVTSDIQKVPEIRDAKTGALRKAFPEVPDKTTVSGFCLSADRKWLAANTGQEFDPTLTGTPRRDTDITVWEVATGKARGTVTASSLLALAPDGRTLAVTVEGKIELCDVVTGKSVKPAPFKFTAIDAATFSPDGAWLVVSGLNEIAYWKWKDGDTHERLKLGRNVQSLAFSPDSKVLAEGPDYRTTLEVRDLTTMKVAQTLDDGKRALSVETLAFADGGRTLVAGNANLPGKKVEIPHRIHFWDVKTAKLTREIALNRGQPRSLDVSPDDKSLAVILVDGDETILAVWNLDKIPGIGAPKPG